MITDVQHGYSEILAEIIQSTGKQAGGESPESPAGDRARTNPSVAFSTRADRKEDRRVHRRLVFDLRPRPCPCGYRKDKCTTALLRLDRLHRSAPGWSDRMGSLR